MQVVAAPQARRLLRVLLVRLGQMPAGSTSEGLLQQRERAAYIAGVTGFWLRPFVRGAWVIEAAFSRGQSFAMH